MRAYLLLLLGQLIPGLTSSPGPVGNTLLFKVVLVFRSEKDVGARGALPDSGVLERPQLGPAGHIVRLEPFSGQVRLVDFLNAARFDESTVFFTVLLDALGAALEETLSTG